MSTVLPSTTGSSRHRNRTFLIILLGIAFAMAVWGSWYLSYYGLPDREATERYH